MAARPRLVHEGSPIINDNNDDIHHGPSTSSLAQISSTKSYKLQTTLNVDEKKGHDTDHLDKASKIRKTVATHDAGISAAKPYKLQTRLVVGGGSSNHAQSYTPSMNIANHQSTVNVDHQQIDLDIDVDRQKLDGLHHEQIADVNHQTAHQQVANMKQQSSIELDDDLDMYMMEDDEFDNDHNESNLVGTSHPHHSLVDRNSQTQNSHMLHQQQQYQLQHYQQHHHLFPHQELNNHQQHFHQSPTHSIDSSHQNTAVQNTSFHNGTLPHQHRLPNDYSNNTPPNNEMPANNHLLSILHNPNPTMPPPSKSPLIIIDGANIAYNYAESLNPSSSEENFSTINNHPGRRKYQHKRQPDPRGITLAIRYFLQHKCRVQAVVPISWYRGKPAPADAAISNREDSKMVTEEVEELRALREGGFLVACPPGDDDDAYALTLARREEDRLMERERTNLMRQEVDKGGMDSEASDFAGHSEVMAVEDSLLFPTSVLGGYVLSNDMFHDAIRRDQKKRSEETDLSHYGTSNRTLQNSLPQHGSKSMRDWLKNNRISYSFADVGLTSEVDGKRELEFIANPRNRLIEDIEARQRHYFRAS